MSSDHSTFAPSYALIQQLPTTGTHKVKYRSDAPWDFYLDLAHKAIDLSLILPHYRARHQPVDHRMTMFIGNESGPVKLKVCRNLFPSRFYLEIQGDTSDVTVWLPSDFKGKIHHSGRATFSAGFVNRIMRNVCINEPEHGEAKTEDVVVVYTRGNVTFRMWDVQACAPERPHKESLKRIFGCNRRTPETVIDWDFLLRD